MIIESLKIENFRQYKGPIQIDFSLDNNKNFTIIKGTNGAGKTNLLNAITWCLYGSELHKTSSSESDSIFNNIIKNETNPNGTFVVKVELIMRDNFNDKISIQRSLTFNKNLNGDLFPDAFGDKLNIYYSEDGNDKPLEFPEIFIDKNMPINIEEYFFFDGEKLEEYFEENSGSTIKEAVSKISQLNLFERLENNLKLRKKDYIKESKSLDKDIGGFLGQKDDIESKLRRASKEKKESNSEIKNITIKLKELHKELMNINHEDVNQLEFDKDKLEKENEDLNNKISSILNKKRDYFILMFPLILSYESMDFTRNLGKDLEQKGFIPPKYKKDFLEDLLNEKKCICGRELFENGEGYNNIKKLKDETSGLTNISEEVNVSLRNMEIIMDDVEDFNKKRKKFNKEILDANNSLNKNNQELESIKYKFGLIDHEEIQRITNQIEDYEHVKTKKIATKVNAERDIEDFNKQLQSIEKEERIRVIQDEKIQRLTKYVNFSEEAIAIVGKLKNNITENIRLKIEKATSEQFKKLMWKNNFSKVSINHNYDVFLKDITKEIVTPGILSAGEKLVLALSFVSALNMISGFDLPLIIDTPMGRLDHEMKSNISRTLPDYVKGKQVTLLVTGEEYTDDFRNGIIDNVNNEYVIEVHEEENGTESRVVLNE